MADSAACVLVDVNAMQRVNHEHGYEFGDRLLANVADILKTSFVSATVHRLPGDEFMLSEIRLDFTEIASRLSLTTREIHRRFGVTLAAGVGFGRTAVEAKAAAIKGLFRQKQLTSARSTDATSDT